MNLIEKEQGEVRILEIEGNLDTGTSGDAEKALMAMIENGASKILIDCSALDYVSSAGLRVFLFIAKQLKAKDGGFRICGLNETVQEVFDISGFSSIFDVRTDADTALSDF